MGGRTPGQGYAWDSTRQQFTGYERDAETGLDFAQARYSSSSQGRFTSPDPLGASMTVADPQSFNRYSYTRNDPVNRTDPTGMKDNIISPDGAAGGFLPGADGAMGRAWPGDCPALESLSNTGQRWMMPYGEGDAWATSAAAGVEVGSAVAGALLDGLAGGTAANSQNTIADDVKAILTNPDSQCGVYVTSLINTVAELTNRPAFSADGVTLVEKIASQGRYVITPLKGIGGTIGGSIRGGDAAVYIAPDSDPNRNIRIYNADVGLHETIHHAAGTGRMNGYTDERLADAAFKLMTPERKAILPLPQMGGYPNTGDGSFQYILARGRYWDKELLSHCPLPRRKD